VSGGRARYAVYFAPDRGSPLAEFGAAWLGYDADSGHTAPQPALPALAADRLHAITAEPRHYGFHATLKPPFVLAGGDEEAALRSSLAALAAELRPFAAPPLKLTRLSGFLALTPSAPSPDLERLAAHCVREFDRFRAPAAPAEIERRRRVGLSPRQEELLTRWGYPYVMDQFRFHLTLTGRLDPDEGAGVCRLLALMVAPLCQAPLPVTALTLFNHDGTDAPFRIIGRYPFGGTLSG